VKLINVPNKSFIFHEIAIVLLYFIFCKSIKKAREKIAPECKQPEMSAKVKSADLLGN